MQLDTHILITIITEHIQVDDTNNIVHFISVVGDVFLTTPKTLFLASKEYQFNGSVKLVVAEQAGSFHECGNTTGVVFRSWCIRSSLRRGAVHVRSHQDDLSGVRSMTWNGDNLIFPHPRLVRLPDHFRNSCTGNEVSTYLEQINEFFFTGWVIGWGV